MKPSKLLALILSLAIVLAPMEFAVTSSSMDDLDMSNITMASVYMDNQDIHGHAMHDMDNSDQKSHGHDEACDEPCGNCASCSVALTSSLSSGNTSLANIFSPLTIKLVQAVLERDLDPPIFL